jgi:plastocyanin
MIESPVRLLRTSLRLFALFAAAVLAGWYSTDIAWAAQTFGVSQKNRSFNFKRITVTTGDTVQFNNDDEFIHQIYIDAREFSVDTAESPPGAAIDVKFTVPGTFEVHCHIHPKMLLVVAVK